jgi:hypothetical protein
MRAKNDTDSEQGSQGCGNKKSIATKSTKDTDFYRRARRKRRGRRWRFASKEHGAENLN